MSEHPDLGSALSSPIPSARHANVATGRLLDLQFWLMGRDVVHPAGNVLLRLGFVRDEAAGERLPARYIRSDHLGLVIVWRCGLYLPAGRTLMVRGHEPGSAAPSGLAGLYDTSAVFGALDNAQACSSQALADACLWLADYEGQVEDAVGTGHRRPGPGRRPSAAPPEACALTRAWTELASIHSARYAAERVRR